MILDLVLVAVVVAAVVVTWRVTSRWEDPPVRDVSPRNLRLVRRVVDWEREGWL